MVANQTELTLFQEEPGGAIAQQAHRQLAIAIRKVLIAGGLVIEVWSVVVNVYLISTQEWGAYCRLKIMEQVGDILNPWLEKSRRIGQSEEEQGALMDEFLATLQEESYQSQSTRGNEMTPTEWEEMDSLLVKRIREATSGTKSAASEKGPMLYAAWAGVLVALIAAAIAFWAIWHTDAHSDFESLRNQEHQDFMALIGKVDEQTKSSAVKFDAMNRRFESLETTQGQVLQYLRDEAAARRK